MKIKTITVTTEDGDITAMFDGSWEHTGSIEEIERQKTLKKREYAADRMMRTGGRFFQHIGSAYMHADPTNAEILANAYQKQFKDYAQGFGE